MVWEVNQKWPHPSTVVPTFITIHWKNSPMALLLGKLGLGLGLGLG